MAAPIVSLDAYRMRRILRGAPPPPPPPAPRPVVLCHACGRPIRSGGGLYPLGRLRAARACADCYMPF